MLDRRNWPCPLPARSCGATTDNRGHPWHLRHGHGQGRRQAKELASTLDRQFPKPRNNQRPRRTGRLRDGESTHWGRAKRHPAGHRRIGLWERSRHHMRATIWRADVSCSSMCMENGNGLGRG